MGEPTVAQRAVCRDAQCAAGAQRRARRERRRRDVTDMSVAARPRAASVDCGQGHGYRVRELDILHDQGRCVCQPCAPAAARDSDRREDVQKYPHTHIIFARAAQSILVSQVLVHLLWSWVAVAAAGGRPDHFSDQHEV